MGQINLIMVSYLLQLYNRYNYVFNISTIVKLKKFQIQPSKCVANKARTREHIT